MTNELLIYQSESDANLQPLFDVAQVLQQLPHVLLVQDRPEVRERLQSMKGVRCLSPNSRSIPLPGLLSETEKLFVRGWLKRVGGTKRKRLHDRMAWDSEGYKAP